MMPCHMGYVLRAFFSPSTRDSKKPCAWSVSVCLHHFMSCVIVAQLPHHLGRLLLYHWRRNGGYSVFTLQDNVDKIRRFELGETSTVVGRYYSIRLSLYADGSPVVQTMLCASHKPHLAKMENVLQSESGSQYSYHKRWPRTTTTTQHKKLNTN